ncbi:uncharacterized protein LOC118895910 [Balaenoptera musculus]|uniref:Uncharacterized protein LOC118895910 n=1 Tax=Balaenoptera musculus TaxID=9771 RepID=A0A8B8XHZ1_BALMU|nr:uncharacterized protein LOC118895910 [Balaenoptera musculus]
MLAVRANSLPRVQLTLGQQQGQGRQHCNQWKIRCNFQQALGTAVVPYPWFCITGFNQPRILFLSQGRLSVLIKAEEGNLIDKDRVRRAGSHSSWHQPAGSLGGGREEAGSCGTFLELSELDEVQNSALCAAGPRFLRTPQLGWAGQARVPRPPPAGAESVGSGGRRRAGTRQRTSNLCSAASGGWRGEPATAIKGQKGKYLRAERHRKPKSRSRGRGGPAGSPSRGGGDGCVRPELGGVRGEGFRGEFPRPFSHQHLPSHSGEAKLCTSIESGLQSRGRRAARRGGRGRPAPFPGVGPLRPRTNQLGFPWTPGTQGVPTPNEKKSEREKRRGEGKAREGGPESTCRIHGRRAWHARLPELRLRPGSSACPSWPEERENCVGMGGYSRP